MMRYLLMNKDNTVAEIEARKVLDTMTYELGGVFGKLPYGFKTANEWLAGRQAAKHRKHLERLMKECDCFSIEGYIRVLHCVSINDTFWVKREDETVSWKNVSLFDNEFDETITRIAFEGTGMCREQFTSTSPEFSIDGAYEKCCIRENGSLYIIKRGTTGYANAGLEPYSEVFTYPIYKHLVGVATEYSLVNYHGHKASKCKVFTNDSVGFASYAKVGGEVNDISVVSFYDKLRFVDTFNAMLVADAVCYNTDRHAGNHGVLFNTETLDMLCMAPPFDHNLSLLPYIMKSDFPTVHEYLKEQGPRIGNDWVAVARSVLSPYLRAQLVSLKGYTIPYEGDEKFTKERIEVLNTLINEQIDAILR